MKYWLYLGILSSFVSILLWIILIFFNPYNSAPQGKDVLFRTALFLLVPAFFAVFGALIKSRIIMCIAFFWSLPLSLYLVMTPSIFKLFMVTSLCYLLSGIMMRKRVDSD
ncbi:hypothetical protein [Paenibacillus sp. OV219]|uniref:hypothetical protein n=1 Tax=Paenibacillus sp. OV219 TaxID=1884377 RepID=UPI0008D58BFC|nr:hypothetical protein [Paenibacillus sp. OV219]SEO03272.1 hypothetical protein SAMN05518847_105303 [Paenibacillus sp. OV219]